MEMELIDEIDDILSEWESMRKHGVGISRYEAFNRRCIKILKKIKESGINGKKYKDTDILRYR